MEHLSNRVYSFIDSRPDDATEKIYSVAFRRKPFDEGDPKFFDDSLNTLFSNLYKDGYLTKKPTVFAGFSEDKISIELFLDK